MVFDARSREELAESIAQDCREQLSKIEEFLRVGDAIEPGIEPGLKRLREHSFATMLLAVMLPNIERTPCLHHLLPDMRRLVGELDELNNKIFDPMYKEWSSKNWKHDQLNIVHYDDGGIGTAQKCVDIVRIRLDKIDELCTRLGLLSETFDGMQHEFPKRYPALNRDYYREGEEDGGLPACFDRCMRNMHAAVEFLAGTQASTLAHALGALDAGDPTEKLHADVATAQRGANLEARRVFRQQTTALAELLDKAYRHELQIEAARGTQVTIDPAGRGSRVRMQEQAEKLFRTLMRKEDLPIPETGLAR